MVPTVYPGRVLVEGEERPPPAKKWAGIDVSTDCTVEADEVLLAFDRVRRDDKGRRYVPFGPEQVSALVGQYHRRWAMVLAGISVSGARPFMSAMSKYNQAKALLGRAFRKPAVQAKPGIWKWAERFERILLPEGFRRATLTPEEWLESMPSGRRKVLALAMEKYQRWGWKKGYCKFKAFVKSERLPGFGKSDTEVWLERDFEMIDRLIQGPSDESHCVVGPEVKPFVAQLKEQWTTDFPIFYGSVTPEKQQVWLRETLLPGGVPGDHLYFWSDFSMFDNTHSDQTWDFMEGLYWRAGVESPDFWKAMTAWRRPHGKIGPFRYAARVMNASGRDDTALANGVLNGFASYLSACAAFLRIPLTTLTPEMVLSCFDEVRISVCGDDSLGRLPMMSDAEIKDFSRAMKENIGCFGFEAKLDYSDRVHDAVYLGARPYPTREGWVWGKTIGRAVYKMGWVEEKAGRDPSAVMYGIADMHRRCSAAVPVLSDLAEKICQLNHGQRITHVIADQNKPWEWHVEGGAGYDDATLEYVAQTYSHRNRPLCSIQRACEFEVTAEDLRGLIGHIRSIEALPCVIGTTPYADLLRHIIWVDDL